MPEEPYFVLNASDPASAHAMREYILCRKRQGALAVEIDRLQNILLSFAAHVRAMSRPPVQTPTPKAASVDGLKEATKSKKRK